MVDEAHCRYIFVGKEQWSWKPQTSSCVKCAQVKNCRQQRIPVPWDLRFIYRGYIANLGNMLIKRSLQIPLTATITSTLTGGVTRRLSDSEQLLAAFAGGWVSAFISSPIGEDGRRAVFHEYVAGPILALTFYFCFLPTRARHDPTAALWD